LEEKRGGEGKIDKNENRILNVVTQESARILRGLGRKAKLGKRGREFIELESGMEGGEGFGSGINFLVLWLGSALVWHSESCF
jgi:hypothetical protein